MNRWFGEVVEVLKRSCKEEDSSAPPKHPSEPKRLPSTERLIPAMKRKGSNLIWRTKAFGYQRHDDHDPKQRTGDHHEGDQNTFHHLRDSNCNNMIAQLTLQSMNNILIAGESSATRK